MSHVAVSHADVTDPWEVGEPTPVPVAAKSHQPLGAENNVFLWPRDDYIKIRVSMVAKTSLPLMLPSFLTT